MKVDKAVCTNGTLEDLNRAIQFEAVFSTLVENKILAIKRECELKKRHKKTRLLRRILFGRKVSGGAPPTGCTSPGEREEQLPANGSAAVDPESRCGNHGHNGATSGAFGYALGAEAANLVALENSTISDGVDEVIVEIGDLSSLVDADGNVVVTTGADAAGSVGSRTDGGGHPFNGSIGQRAPTSGFRRASDVTRGSGSVTTLPRKASLLEPVSIEIEPESDPLSAELELDSATNVSIELDGVSDVSDMRRSIASEPISIIKNANRSRFGSGTQHGPFLSAGHAANRLRVLEAKSISAQNSPILPRQKPAAEGRHLTFSTATYQQPASTKACTIDCDTSFVVDLSQHQHNSTVIVKDKSGGPGSASGGAADSGGRRTGSQSGSRKSASLALGDNSSSSSASKRNKLSQHLATRGTTQGAEATAGPPPPPPASSSSPPPPPLGLIESFNQLTASNLPVISAKMHSARQSPPVSDTVKLQQQQQHHRRPSSSIILPPGDDAGGNSSSHPDAHSPLALRKASCSSAGAAVEGQALLKTPTPTQLPPQNQRKQQQRSFLRQSSCDVELHYRPSVCVGSNRRSSAKEHHHHHRKSSGYGCHGDDYSSYIMGYDINESDEEKLNKRKYKYLKRCSDPVIVFPSTSSGAGAAGGGGSGGSGLQHCILSRPPNQPLQFPYDDDFMYDVSLQIESDRHGELDSIVIDPDDLPQRARWTIIATACLLLIMCLLLVGITLRMAPIIDDMGE
ncbi:AGAP005073-PA-like protein [Anopheles sinensis]|uniref:AGAP005073-PA-like protein n=1 Tax=Anopheles sinensis TaxID=74873 RepID=A0A084WJF1_ANOSI|nr:AGAP005073-PA-like protein [Anopheles sinensis]